MWVKIKEMVGTEVPTSNKNGNLNWKVVESESITIDIFEDLRESEAKVMKKTVYNEEHQG